MVHKFIGTFKLVPESVNFDDNVTFNFFMVNMRLCSSGNHLTSHDVT